MIEHYGWGAVNGISVGSTELENHACSDVELGLLDANDSESFGAYPIFGSSANEVKTWKKKFKCVKKEDLVIWGDYNSAKA